MSDEPKQEPFAQALPPVPETEEEREAREEAEREELARQQEEAATAPPRPPQPLTDQQVYPTPPTADPKVTHTAMSAEQLKELGYDEDGNPAGEPNPVEEEQQPEPGAEA